MSEERKKPQSRFWRLVNEERERQFLRCIPEALEFRSLLYIGANANRRQMLDLFVARKFRIDILEIWPENAAEVAAWNAGEGAGAISKIHIGDVRLFERPAGYDVVVWWHGPEHIERSELPAVLGRLERTARGMVVLAAPSGRSPQGDAYGNPHERHRAALYPRDFRDLGYRINILGKTDRDGSNLLAWKRSR
jgi:hypothetical protein